MYINYQMWLGDSDERGNHLRRMLHYAALGQRPDRSEPNPNPGEVRRPTVYANSTMHLRPLKACRCLGR